MFTKAIATYKSFIILFFIFFLLSFVLFYPTLRFDFIVDDWTLIWTTLFHPTLYGIYWSHPATVAEFFVFTYLFGAHTLAFNLFGIFLRSFAALSGYLLLSYLTKNKYLGFFFGLLLVSSYIGLQSTSWASAHIVEIDLILTVYSVYRFLRYMKDRSKENFFIFLLVFALTIIADPGRNFVLVFFLSFLVLFQDQHVSFRRLVEKYKTALLSVFISTVVIFFSWFVLFGYFFNKGVIRHHTHIPFETLQYFFGSLANLILDPYLKTFEFASNTTSPYLPLYILIAISACCLFVYCLYTSKRSLSSFLFSFFFFWTFLFYLPSWFSYPRLFVPAIYRYLTISGFAFLAILALLTYQLYIRKKLIGIILGIVLLITNLVTLHFHIQQEAYLRTKNIPKIWYTLEKDIPKREADTIFYLTGNEPFISWGMVYSQANPLRIKNHVTNPVNTIIVADILGKVANVLCHRGITNIQTLQVAEPTLHFRSWHIDDFGRVTNTTTIETHNLESFYQDPTLCVEMKKNFGDSFTYYN